MNKEETKQIAKDLYDSTINPYKERWENLKAERDELYQEWKDIVKDTKKAYEEYKEIAKEAQTRYYKNIGE